MCDHNWVLILTSDFMPAGRRIGEGVGSNWRMCLVCSRIQEQTHDGWQFKINETSSNKLIYMLLFTRPVDSRP